MKKKKKKPSLRQSLLVFSILIGLGIVFYGKKQKQSDPPYVSVVGFVNMADGLGRQAVELIGSLKDSVDVGFVPSRKIYERDFEGVPPGVVSIIKNSKKSVARQAKILVYEDALYWPTFEPYKTVGGVDWDDQIRIAYTMFESSRIPEEWKLILNLYFDAAVVPDPFLVDVYKKSGVTIPIFVLPLGLDLSPFFNLPLKKEKNTPFVFGNFGWCCERKNQLNIVRAFARAFGNDPKVKLVLNSRSGHPAYTSEVKEAIESLGMTNIDFYIQSLSKEDYLNLFQKVDCYVSAAKGEGFSIQPREAMALGIPSIVTDNSAQTTICNSNLVRVLPSPIEESATFTWGITYGTWWNCSEEALAQSMRDVYENFNQYLSKGPQAREWVKQYQFNRLHELYLSMVKPKKILFGEKNEITPEYIMTNSESLYQKYLSLQ